MHTYAFKQSCDNDSCNEPRLGVARGRSAAHRLHRQVLGGLDRLIEESLGEMTRNFNSNVNSKFVARRLQSQCHGAHGSGEFHSTLLRYGPTSSYAAANWQYHRRKDTVKTFVDKALALHDARHGMSPVSNLNWAGGFNYNAATSAGIGA